MPWQSNAPEAVVRAVAAIACHDIAAASGNLAPQDLEDSPWQRGYDDAIKWLREVGSGSAELNVDWPNVQESSGHRACMSIRQRGTD
jgi:phage gp36-like protein